MEPSDPVVPEGIVSRGAVFGTGPATSELGLCGRAQSVMVVATAAAGSRNPMSPRTRLTGSRINRRSPSATNRVPPRLRLFVRSWSTPSTAR